LRRLVSIPAWCGLADRNPGERAGHCLELRDVVRARDDVADVTTINAILEIGGREEGRGGGDDDTELDRGEERFPERDLVAEHQHQAVAPSRAHAAQVVRDTVRCCRQFREGADGLGSVLFDNVQGRTIVAGGDRIEVVERPVEVMECRPAKTVERFVIIGSVLQDEVATLQE